MSSPTPLPTPPPTFPKIPFLPPELCLHIWALAMPPPRILTLSQSAHGGFKPLKTPAIFHTGSESRIEALRLAASASHHLAPRRPAVLPTSQGLRSRGSAGYAPPQQARPHPAPSGLAAADESRVQHARAAPCQRVVAGAGSGVGSEGGGELPRNSRGAVVVPRAFRGCAPRHGGEVGEDGSGWEGWGAWEGGGCYVCGGRGGDR
ncbi:hypothetical protein BU16DRAFT_542630 [Lophium mytilinum]|uniref:2EXR domain-containing protein n=1 Tax=Lophium mytilinum TaxID=390894 RepID=A0A6A6QIM8_9PEZI|nr:hypothetical protein BU16DRAFT_542630 [Lophium mytilinum]